MNKSRGPRFFASRPERRGRSKGSVLDSLR